MQKRKEEVEEEEEERKRKAADETGTVERRKKKRDASDTSLKAGRKEQKRSEETSSGMRRPPAVQESESAEHKKTLRRKEAAEGEEQEKAEQKKSGEKKKRESLLVEGEANDVSERSERRKSTRKTEKMDGEKVDRKKSVKKKDTGLERDVSEGGDRTERKKSAKKRDSVVTPDSSVERKKTSRKKDTSGDDQSGKDDSESAYVSLSVINGEVGDVGEGEREEEEEDDGERGESGIGLGRSGKEAVRLDQSPSPQESGGSGEGKVRLGDLQECPMEVEEDVKKSSSRSQSGESGRVTKGSGSSVSRESMSPVKKLGGAAPPPTSTTTTTTTTTTATTTTTTAAAAAAAAAASSSQGSPHKKPSPPPSQPPKVRKTDSKSLFQTASKSQGETRPAESVAAGSRRASRVLVKAPQPVTLTEKVLQEATDKIKCEDKKEEKEPHTLDSAQPTGRSETSKGSGQPSSVPLIPARSRDGSESSGEAAPRPARPDGARRQSKVFKAAAMWENDRTSKSSSAQPDKLKKPVRTGASIMSDLTKKFEVKPSVERRSKVVPSLKVIHVVTFPSCTLLVVVSLVGRAWVWPWMR